jgi:hypothetical protein
MFGFSLPKINFNPLIYTGGDYIVALSIKNVPYPLILLQEINYNAKKNINYEYKIGSEEPIEIITSNATYSGKIQIEAGVLEIILIANQISAANQIRDAYITIISTAGVLLKMFQGVCITNYDGTVKAKDKRSLITLDFNAIGIIGT